MIEDAQPAGRRSTGVSHAALKALPYNAMHEIGKEFPAGLDLSANRFMGGVGVNLDNVSMPHVTLPGNAHIISAKGAHIEQSQANTSTFSLTAVGGNTGFHALPDSSVKASGKVIDLEAAALDAPKIMSNGQQARNNKSVSHQWAGYLGVSGAPGMLT